MRNVPIENVFNFIPVPVRDQIGDDDQILSWCMQYLRTLNIRERYVQDWTVERVENHRASMPAGYRKIENMTFLRLPPTDKEIDGIQQVLGIRPQSSGTQHDEDREIKYHPEFAPKIYYQLFVDSAYHAREHCKLNFVGNTTAEFFSSEAYRDFLQKRPGRCTIDFSISPDGCDLQFSEASGWVSILYTTEMRNGEGEFTLPDEPVQMWQALGHFAIAQYWLNQTHTGKPDAFSMYQQFLNMARTYMLEAKGIFKMKNISFDRLSDITYRSSRILRIPAVFAGHVGA